MKKNCIFILLLSASFLSLFAEDVLNNPAYISQTGYGETKESAQNNALSALSKFFQMKISVSETEHTTLANDEISSSISEDVFVQSETELFAVRYTKPKYDKKQKQFEVTAYIDREEAWQIYEPKVQDCVSSFESFYSSANSKADTFLKLAGFSKAYKNASQNELSKKLDFANILNPDQAAQFDITRNHLSEIEVAVHKLASQCTFFILCENDFDKAISRSVGEFLSKSGIVIGDKKSEYLCSIKIIENNQVLPAGTFYSPSFSLKILCAGEVLFSSEGQLKKVGAKNEDVARQRAYQTVAKSIQDTLKKELIPF